MIVNMYKEEDLLATVNNLTVFVKNLEEGLKNSKDKSYLLFAEAEREKALKTIEVCEYILDNMYR